MSILDLLFIASGSFNMATSIRKHTYGWGIKMMSASPPVPRFRLAVLSLAWSFFSLRTAVAGTCGSFLSSSMLRKPIVLLYQYSECGRT